MRATTTIRKCLASNVCQRICVVKTYKNHPEIRLARSVRELFVWSKRILYRHRPQIALQEKLDTMARAGDKLGRHPPQSREKDGKGKQDGPKSSYNSIRVEGRQENDKAAAAAKSEIRNRDKLGTHGGSGSQERNHEGRQACETSRQRQPRAKNHEGRQAWETSRQRQPRAKL